MRKELNDGMMDFLEAAKPKVVAGKGELKNTLRSVTGDDSNMTPGKLSRACKAFTGEYRPQIFPNRSWSMYQITKKEKRTKTEGRVVKNAYGKKVTMGKMQVVKKTEISKPKSPKSSKVPLEKVGHLDKVLGGK